MSFSRRVSEPSIPVMFTKPFSFRMAPVAPVPAPKSKHSDVAGSMSIVRPGPITLVIYYGCDQLAYVLISS